MCLFMVMKHMHRMGYFIVLVNVVHTLNFGYIIISKHQLHHVFHNLCASSSIWEHGYEEKGMEMERLLSRSLLLRNGKLAIQFSSFSLFSPVSKQTIGVQ